MFEDTYKTIAAPSEGLYKEKGSKFLAFAYPVHNLDEIKTHLEQLRKDYFDARHHCYAYILGPRKDAFRANDDGEPSGTGGRPIHGQLLSADLTDTLIVVVRYFGGILLGASGLANAYKAAARDAIDHATIIQKTIDARYRLAFAYERPQTRESALRHAMLPRSLCAPVAKRPFLRFCQKPPDRRD